MESARPFASAADKIHRHQRVSAFPYPCDNLLVRTFRFTANRKLQRPGPPLHALVRAVSRLGYVRAVAQEHQLPPRSRGHLQGRSNANLEVPKNGEARLPKARFQRALSQVRRECPERRQLGPVARCRTPHRSSERERL